MSFPLCSACYQIVNHTKVDHTLGQLLLHRVVVEVLELILVKSPALEDTLDQNRLEYLSKTELL